jgi:choline dehydrogenase-like flavoprotein
MAPFALVVGALAALAAVTPAAAAPDAAVKRQVTHLRDKYDFVIVGGGTAGLTVADRLTARFPSKNVLVVNYGDIQYAPGGFDPPQTLWGGPTLGAAANWTFNSLPNPAVKNKTALVFAGKAVGGSSTINGMFFDRGSRYDFEAWAKVVGPVTDSSKSWDWNGIFPYFKKVSWTQPGRTRTSQNARLTSVTERHLYRSTRCRRPEV